MLCLCLTDFLTEGEGGYVNFVFRALQPQSVNFRYIVKRVKCKFTKIDREKRLKLLTKHKISVIWSC